MKLPDHVALFYEHVMKVREVMAILVSTGKKPITRDGVFGIDVIIEKESYAFHLKMHQGTDIVVSCDLEHNDIFDIDIYEWRSIDESADIVKDVSSSEELDRSGVIEDMQIVVKALLDTKQMRLGDINNTKDYGRFNKLLIDAMRVTSEETPNAKVSGSPEGYATVKDVRDLLQFNGDVKKVTAYVSAYPRVLYYGIIKDVRLRKVRTGKHRVTARFGDGKYDYIDFGEQSGQYLNNFRKGREVIVTDHGGLMFVDE